MLAVWWLGKGALKVAAAFVFACAVFFVREVVYETFSPARQAEIQQVERPGVPGIALLLHHHHGLRSPWTVFRAASDMRLRSDTMASSAFSKLL